MTDRELMQQALDAMLNFPNDISDEMFESIRVLRARLAQPEQEIESDRDPVEDDGCPTEKAVLQRFWREHQMQEPHGYLWFTRHMEQRFTHRQPKEDERVGDVKPVYTAPPQREWQGLTDGEIDEINGSPMRLEHSGLLSFARAIEAKLKEKNEMR